MGYEASVKKLAGFKRLLIKIEKLLAIQFQKIEKKQSTTVRYEGDVEQFIQSRQVMSEEVKGRDGYYLMRVQLIET